MEREQARAREQLSQKKRGWPFDSLTSSATKKMRSERSWNWRGCIETDKNRQRISLVMWFEDKEAAWDYLLVDAWGGGRRPSNVGVTNQESS
jgi:hypothetical protein